MLADLPSWLNHHCAGDEHARRGAVFARAANGRWTVRAWWGEVVPLPPAAVQAAKACVTARSRVSALMGSSVGSPGAGAAGVEQWVVHPLLSGQDLLAVVAVMLLRPDPDAAQATPALDRSAAAFAETVMDARGVLEPAGTGAGASPAAAGMAEMGRRQADARPPGTSAQADQTARAVVLARATTVRAADLALGKFIQLAAAPAWQRRRATDQAEDAEAGDLAVAVGDPAGPLPTAGAAPEDAAGLPVPPLDVAVIPELVPDEAAGAQDATRDDRLGARTVLHWIQAAMARPDLVGSANALAATLTHGLAADRVSVGLRNGATELRIAGATATRVDAREQPGDAALTAAMDEVMQDGAVMAWPPSDDAPPRIMAAHAHLALGQGHAVLCSVPLVREGEMVGAITVERMRSEPFGERQQRALRELGLTLGPWYAGLAHAAQPWRVRLREAWRARLGAASGQGRVKLAVVGGAMALAAALLWPLPVQIKAEARIEGTVQRVVATPADGFLEEVRVRPGDVVAAGDVLVQLQSDDLQAERRRLLAELDGAEAATSAAMGAQDRSEMAIQQAKSDELHAQVALMDQKIERAQVKAPFDGVVIDGDLTHQIGAPVKKGDKLLMLAPAQGYRAVVEVDDADIADVRLGQRGSMVLTAHPRDALPLAVERITPLAGLRDGRNDFEVEVALDARTVLLAQALRPGMRGIAHLDAGRAPLLIHWTRQAVNWLRLASWRWLG